MSKLKSLTLGSLVAAIETEGGFYKSWAELTDQLRERIRRDQPNLAALWDSLAPLDNLEPIRRREMARLRDARHEPTPAHIDQDQDLVMELAFEIAEAKQEKDPPDYNGRMTKKANLRRQREELASAEARIDAWATGGSAVPPKDDAPLAPQPAPLPAPAPPEKRGGGRKRPLRSSTIAHLRQHYPNGKPDAVSYDMIRAEMGKALQPSDKTIREAFKDMLLQQAK